MGHKSHNQELAEPGFKSRFFDSSPWCFYPIKLSSVDLLDLWASKTCNSQPRSRTQLSKTQVTQSCQTLCDPVDYTVCGILQARILEWVAFPFSRGSSQPRDWTQVSCIAGGFFTNWTIREAPRTQLTYSRWKLGHSSGPCGILNYFFSLHYSMMPGNNQAKFHCFFDHSFFLSAVIIAQKYET